MRSLLLSNSFSNKWPETKEAKDSNQMLMKIVHSLRIVSVRMVNSKSKYCANNLILLFNNNRVKSFNNRIITIHFTLHSHKMKSQRQAMEFFQRLITFLAKKKLTNLNCLLSRNLRRAGKNLKRIWKEFGQTLLCLNTEAVPLQQKISSNQVYSKSQTQSWMKIH